MARQAARVLGRSTPYRPPSPLRTRLSRWIMDYRLQLAVVVVLHFSLALVYKELSGVDIAANPGERGWDWWWQTIPAHLLREKLWESLFYLHYQPPFFNIYGALFHNLFPADPLHAMQIGNIFLGSAIVGMVFLTVRLRAKLPILALLAGLIVALDPGLFLFEAYILYDVLTTFWLVAGVYFFSKYRQQQRLRYATLFFLFVNLLVLTRSAYHLLIIPVAILAAGLATERNRQKVVVAGLLISLLSTGWYAKNFAVFGFFGSSSWRGMSLWKVASFDYSEAQLNELVSQGIIDSLVVEQAAFSPAASYETYGFDYTSDIELLRQDDRRNINMIAVDRIYEANALRLIAREPERYLRSVWRGYQVYALPSALFRHHRLNAEKIRLHAAISSELFQGNVLQRYTSLQFGSIFWPGIPLVLLAYGGYLVNRIRNSRQRILLMLASESVELWIVFLVAYTTLVSVVFEIGENNRLRFYIEYLLFALAFITGRRVASMIAARVQQHERGTGAITS
jgi:4-amino-4-deoxy-L-arabinose transferase-like glycosyltransferase